MPDGEKVLVVGGAGYVGSQCSKALSRAGFSPVVFDNLSTGHRDLVKWGPLVEGDINRKGDLLEALRSDRFVGVFHFAAASLVAESVSDPGKYYRNNVAGTLNLLEAIRETRIVPVIFSSTCAVYGVPTRVPIPEDHPKNPIQAYGASKRMIERMLEDFSRAYRLPFAALRYFNAAGADPEGETGEDHAQETHLIPILLQAALGLRPSISIFGTDYDTPDGTCIRDYIHTHDLAQAHVSSLELLRKGGDSGFFNLGNGSGHSVREVLETARRITGKTIPAEEADRRPGDPPRLLGSSERARERLGWKPRFPEIEAILETAWAWTQKRTRTASTP